MEHALYPLIFQPIYKEMVWGGQKIGSLFHKKLPYQHTGESWDLSCRPLEMSIVANGPYQGKPFLEVLNLDRPGNLGRSLHQQDAFPLLIKRIDANDNLSVQVHPDDCYAQQYENYKFGKTELWYILDAPAHSELIIGLKQGVSKTSFQNALQENRVEDCLHRLPIRPGDVVYIPAGLAHAITQGVVLVEIQQNSDITYRVYDYNRLGLNGKPRELHIQKALDVMDFEGKLPKATTPGLTIKRQNAVQTYYAANPYFAVIQYDIRSPYTEKSDPEKFYIFTCVSGNCHIGFQGGSLCLAYGDSAFIPADLGSFELSGNCRLLKTFVPHLEKDFISPLKSAGYSAAQWSACAIAGLTENF